MQENMTRMLLVTDVQDIIKKHQAQIITSLKDPDIRYFLNLILTRLASLRFVYKNCKFLIAYADYQHIFVWLSDSHLVQLIHLPFCMLIINVITVLEGVLLIFYMECVMSLMRRILLRSCCR